MYVIFYEDLRRVRRVSFAGMGLSTLLREIHLSFGFDVQRVRKLSSLSLLFRNCVILLQPYYRQWNPLVYKDEIKLTTMFVQKRNGRRESVHFDKITSRISKLCGGLDSKVCYHLFRFPNLSLLSRLTFFILL